jgi:rhodanese-related sulfurtransferase
VLRHNQVTGIDAAGVSPEAYLLDVRESDEWAAGHAPDAHHLPMHEIPGRLDEIPVEGNVVVVCRVGARSAQVVQYLQAVGRNNVRNLDGGMIAWVHAGRPIIDEHGGAAQIA